jgi:SAM-dependent methyltransferase
LAQRGGSGAALRCHAGRRRLERRGRDLCDLGCGTGEFYRHIRARGLSRIDYRGIDISPVAIDYARRKLPGVPFFSADVLELDEPELKHLLACDYLVINGLFTRKGELGTEQRRRTSPRRGRASSAAWRWRRGTCSGGAC